jgi:cytochrome c oxidase subunit 2
LTIKPQSPGTYPIVCNEFCGIGHQSMVGKIIVE